VIATLQQIVESAKLVDIDGFILISTHKINVLSNAVSASAVFRSTHFVRADPAAKVRCRLTLALSWTGKVGSTDPGGAYERIATIWL
jgi:hypothetical protein